MKTLAEIFEDRIRALRPEPAGVVAVQLESRPSNKYAADPGVIDVLKDGYSKKLPVRIKCDATTGLICNAALVSPTQQKK